MMLSRIRSLVARFDSGGPRIAVFGDSHTVALLRAQQYPKRTSEYEHIKVFRLRKEKDGREVGDASLVNFCREIREFTADDFVFSAVGGNQYAIMSTVRSRVDYDFLISEGGELPSSSTQLVPFRALASYIETGVQQTIGPVLRQIRASTDAKLYHLAPPPPKEDNEFIAAHVEGYFAREGLQDLGPTRPELRLKCWKVQLGCLSSLCNELGITLISPPEKTLTAGGYLEPGCYAKDVTHANRRYGEAVFRQILKITKTEKRSRAKHT